ncbi:MAG: penicillin-binding transpeptidase domain-containing protein, partial [Deltaproteobacteria bacterium]|nr:penicillin-binding transpeptidase domain-containing protein [Deltaproteobacteria bacterium]
DKFLDYLLEFGFGKKVWMTQGESKGILFDKSNFKDIDAFVTSFGQGVAVTPIQLLQAFTVFLNGGKIIKPRILLSEPIKHQQVINQNTAQKIKEMLIKSVESGTGRNAKIPGFHVGGKTGTAQKIDPGKRGYIAGKYFSSFIGFVDFGNHEILAMFLIDEPSGDKYLGGQTAAPTFLRFFEKFIAKRLHEKLQIFSNSHAHANTISKTS